MLTTDAPIISVMTVNPVTILPETSLVRVKELLSLHQIRHLLVVDKQKTLVGIVSQTDLAMLDTVDLNLANRSEKRNATDLCAADIMTQALISIEADDSIGLAAALFLTRKLHALPVLDDGDLVGIVTSHDLLRRVFQDVLPLSLA